MPEWELKALAREYAPLYHRRWVHRPCIARDERERLDAQLGVLWITLRQGGVLWWRFVQDRISPYLLAIRGW